jgi:6-phosphogluconolactonase
MWKTHSFADSATMTAACAQAIIAALEAGLEQRGVASLAVSGGSSPAPLYRLLADTPLDWQNISVVLVDERWVEPDAPGSNERFLRETLMTGYAAKASFIGLKTPAATPLMGLAAAEKRLDAIALPFDAIVLGMGADGHTASWFPHAQGLDGAIAKGAGLLAAITAQQSEITGTHVERITLTKSALSGARRCALMIAGSAKAEALNAAMEPGPVADLPIRALLHDPGFTLDIYQAP